MTTATTAASCCSSRPTACARTRSSSYADDGVVPGFRDLLRARRVRVRPRPADPGAAEHRRRLVHARPPARGRACTARPTTRSTSTARRSANSTAAFAATEHPAGRDARPGGRARRQEGRPDRVGRRPQRLDQRPDARLPQLPLRPRRGDQLHRAAGQRFARSPRSSATRRVRPARRARPPARPAGPARRRSYSPAKEMRLRVLDGRRRQVRPQRLHLRLPRTTARRAMTACFFSRTKSRRRQGRRPRRGRVGRRQGQDHRLRPRRQDRRVPDQGRAAGLRPLARPPVPHVGHARDRDLAELDRRARLHRHVRGLRRREVPVLAGRRLRRARGRHRQRGHLHRAGRLLGEALPPADQVRPRQVQAGPRAGRLPGHRRGPAPVPRAGHEEAAQRREQPGL